MSVRAPHSGMLDSLLGRDELKAEIAELEATVETLEAERDDLQRQLEKTESRRKQAVTERQEAQHRVNKLEDRIEQLEDTIDRLQAEETTLSTRHETTLEGRRLDEVLARLESFETDREGALSAYVADGHDIPRELREAFGERAALVSRAAPCLALADDARLLGVCLRLPVAPDPFVEWDDRFRLDREWCQPRGRYTLALVRSDLFAMGTYEGSERTAFHGFDSALKSQHSKGGFSQSRFERLRDEQIDDHIERSLAALDERETDRLFVVGERSVLGEFMHRADETAAVDATGDPEDALADAWRDFWSVQMRVL
jgi:peptide subunit release factor 1 (eRF1)